MPGIPLQLGDQTVNPLLTSMSVAFYQRANFVADKVFPAIPVDTQAGMYWSYPRGTYFRTDVTRRAPGAPADLISYTRNLDSYLCDVYAIAQAIPDQHRANQNGMFDLDRAATMQITQQHLLHRERSWAETYFKTGVWATDISATTTGPTLPSGGDMRRWDEPGSDPVQSIQQLILDRQEATGLKMNTVVMGPRVYLAAINHALVIDRIKFTQSAVPGAALSTQLLAAMWDVDRVFVSDAVINPDNDVSDDAPAGMNFLHGAGKDMLLCYSPPAPALETPAAGYTFVWRGMAGADNAMGLRVKSYRSEREASTFIEAETAWGMKVVAPSLGVFVDNVVS